LTTIRTLPRPINPSEDTGKVSVSKEGHSGFLSIDQLVELKESIDIVSAIESYGLEKFHKRDAFHATACCPFHSDQSPSLSIDGTRRIFKCFGCGVGGDIFRFVREYSKLEGQEEMSFYRAVRYVSEHFADGSLQSLPSAASKRTPRIMTDEEREQLHHRKERILLANAAAAAFYVENLKKPFAGGARYYLLSRGLTAATVRAFGIGFALDAYFDGPSSAKKTWGEGSLVHHLRDLGFSPEEIMDAGLAIQRKKSAKEDRAREIDERVRETANNTMQEEVDYSSLMDRFRNRLMVPILDGSGKNVLGFGGRIIPSPDESDNQNIEYKPAKYLNSPESVVFEKKRITFGQHLAREAILKEMRQSQSSQTPPIVLVEGYMDAIALSTAGITAVASMGTALSSEQLALAARIAGSPGSRIVLCFDNDEAGVASIERLCTNGMLSDITAKHSADVLVGRLPGGTKDPADFVQSRTFSGAKASKVREDFLAEVVNCASSWSDWFIERLLAGYDPDSQRGSKGSFSDIFSRVADFIATTAGPADRTKRACEVAGKLSDVLARDLNTTEVSKAVQIQLESDLLDLASRLAYAKEEIDRRTEGPGAVLSSLSRGHGPNSADGSGDKLSIKALAAVATGNRTSISRKKSFHPRRTRRKTAARRSRIMTRKRPESLTPHFAGFRFAHERDAEWLGLQKGKVMSR
jgi:DNA primase catalytic core